MNINSKSIKIRGIGLLELMMALLIITILLVTATRYYKITRDSQRINETSEMVLAVYAAGVSWLQSNPTLPDDINKEFKDNGLLPSTLKSPWNGEEITIIRGGILGSSCPASEVGSQTLCMTVTGVGTAACTNMQSRFSQAQYKVGCAGNNFSILLFFDNIAY